MDLQTLFYFLAVCFMLGWLVLLLILIVGVMVGVKSVKRVTSKIEAKLDHNTAGLVLSLLPAIPMIVAELFKRSGKKKS